MDSFESLGGCNKPLSERENPRVCKCLLKPLLIRASNEKRAIGCVSLLLLMSVESPTSETNLIEF